jgi:hypothetical protein
MNAGCYAHSILHLCYSVILFQTMRAMQSFCFRLYALMLFNHSVFCLLLYFSVSCRYATTMTTQAAVLRWVDQVSCSKMSWSDFFFAADTLILDQILFFLWYLISFMYRKKTEIIKQWFGDLSEAKFCYFGKWCKWSLFQVYTITYSSIFSQCYGTIVLAKVPNIISSYILSQCCWVITIYKCWITKSPAQSCVFAAWLLADCCLCAWLFA